MRHAESVSQRSKKLYLPVARVGPEGRTEGSFPETDLLSFSCKDQRSSRQRVRNVPISFDRTEAGLFQPIGILRERPTLALRRVGQRVHRKTQSKGRLGALFVGHKVIDDKNAARFERRVRFREELLISLR